MKNMKNKEIAKILIPVLMICIVVGIWFTQNQVDQEKISTSTDSKFPLNVTNVDLEQLKEHELPIIIDFGADECVPCKEMAPVLVTLNKEMQEKAIIQFVDVWKVPEAATAFPVQVIPTQIIINADGTPYMPSDEIASTIQFAMYADRETEEHIFTAHQGGLTENQMRLILADMGVE
ncbi:thiol reductase thioredoxin [Candidatus Epulonipiscium fishelsonii]|uniref:Thiol reductase thioredoxin n=1 Tax=Candidatus Epulonipiscium fishelsonii TaxID=77094 RepID=A0ACC8XGQ5_9FIRM|nr:thiol reductase thioredoxin [Epulopiscium sp. SCG-B05WGA-EpuloA1]ONI42745.1 thiol reductase thioredoxin [Epulopiscium sp. SCG-B11WGA-EpuloA1]